MKIQITLDSAEDREILALVLPLLQGERKAQPSYVLDESETKPVLAEPVEEKAISVQSTLIKSNVTEPVAEEVTPAEPVAANSITKQAWDALLIEKKEKLDIKRGTAKNTAFIDFIKKECSPYGADVPSKLDDAARALFVKEVFERIAYDPIDEKFYLKLSAPF